MAAMLLGSPLAPLKARACSAAAALRLSACPHAAVSRAPLRTRASLSASGGQHDALAQEAAAAVKAYKERQTACLATLSLRAAKARRRATRQANAAAKAEDEYRRTALAAALEEEELTRSWAQRAAMCAAADALEQRQDAERLAEAAREAEALLQRMLQDL